MSRDENSKGAAAHFMAQIKGMFAVASAAKAPSLADSLLLTRHHSGFEREMALRRMLGVHDRAVLLAVIERLNDWVPEVRKAAAGVYQSFLDEARVEELLACIDSLCRLQDKRRADHGALLRKTFDLVLEGRHEAQFVVGFHQIRGKTARALLAEMLDRKPAGWAIDMARNHTDPSVRAMALRASSRLVDEQARHVLEKALAERSLANRSLALRLLIERFAGTDMAMRAAEHCLLVSGNGVRIIARWYVGK
jgi:hypothetical protein